MFYAEHEGEIIAMSIILYDNNIMHYHLSGAKYEYRPLAPTNLLLFEAALWGYKQGFKSFHLGGGLGSGKMAYSNSNKHLIEILAYSFQLENK